MATEVKSPTFPESVADGTIANWVKKEGEKVQQDEVIAEIETDKATMELESYQQGTLLHIGTPIGGKLQVNDLLAIIGNAGEDISALVAQHIGVSKIHIEAPKEESNKIETPASAANESPSALDISKMDEVVLMPRLSDTMTEGVIAVWQKQVGDIVKKGEVLADIETDKATMELESYKDGVLLYQGAQAGEKILVNDLLCIIGKEGLDVNAIIAAVKAGASVASESPKEVSKQTESPKMETPALVSPIEEVVNEGRIFASPLAKKLASDKGIDLKYVKGSGDNGRITKSDVDAFTPQAQAATTTSVSAHVVAPAVTYASGTVSFDEVPVSQMRKIIAKRLSESLFTAPHFYLTMRVDMDAAIAARGVLNADGKTKISFNDMVLKATALALKVHPKINSSWLGDKIRYNHHVNIGVAVAVDEGLLVPVVRFADTLSFKQINAQVKDFAQKAKDKKLQPSDWEGSTFTISNLGMFGIDSFTAIINPPDACILAVGGIAQEPVVKNGQIVPGNVMNVTLSCDHRVVDGATGSAFLQTLKSNLEEPIRMFV